MSLRRQEGFTVVEILVALGIGAVVLGMFASSQISIIKDQIRMRKTLETNIDETLAERILFDDFNGLEPSYNNLTLLDDQGLNFFEFYPDIPEANLRAKKERELTLSLSGRTEFHVLVHDRVSGPVLIYDPVMAYLVGPAPADFNQAAALSFISLNRNKWVSSQRPGFWVNKKLLMLDTPAKVRRLNGGKVDMLTPPRSPIFVGEVNEQELRPLASGLGGLLVQDHPETGEAISSADIFLRKVPSVGGGQALVRLRAVKIVKYFLVKEEAQTATGGESAKLYRSIYENGAFGTPNLLADKVESFSFRRDSVLKRMIQFKVHKTKTM